MALKQNKLTIALTSLVATTLLLTSCSGGTGNEGARSSGGGSSPVATNKKQSNNGFVTNLGGNAKQGGSTAATSDNDQSKVGSSTSDESTVPRVLPSFGSKNDNDNNDISDDEKTGDNTGSNNDADQTGNTSNTDNDNSYLNESASSGGVATNPRAPGQPAPKPNKPSQPNQGSSTAGNSNTKNGSANNGSTNNGSTNNNARKEGSSNTTVVVKPGAPATKPTPAQPPKATPTNPGTGSTSGSTSPSTSNAGGSSFTGTEIIPTTGGSSSKPSNPINVKPSIPHNGNNSDTTVVDPKTGAINNANSGIANAPGSVDLDNTDHGSAPGNSGNSGNVANNGNNSNNGKKPSTGTSSSTGNSSSNGVKPTVPHLDRPTIPVTPGISKPFIPDFGKLPDIGEIDTPTMPTIPGMNNEGHKDETGGLVPCFTDGVAARVVHPASNCLLDKNKEVVHRDEEYNDFDPTLHPNLNRNLDAKFKIIANDEVIDGRRYVDLPTYRPLKPTTYLANTRETGIDGFYQGRLQDSENNYHFRGLIINNPKAQGELSYFATNGIGHYFNAYGIDPVLTPGTNINALLTKRVEVDSTNLSSIYRNWSLSGLQRQIGNQNYNENRADRFNLYNLREKGSLFISTYLGLTDTRRLQTNHYNPLTTLDKAYSRTDFTYQEDNNALNGKGVKVAMVDMAVNTDHPLLEDHIVQYYDYANQGKIWKVNEAYRKQYGVDLPTNHGTAVALVLAAKTNYVQNQYMGIAPRVDLSAYQLILETTPLAQVFHNIKERKNSIVNASFSFGKRDSDNNEGVIEELRAQALDWKDAPLYVFATGNKEHSYSSSAITGLLSDIISDSTISPITLAVTGATASRDRVNDGLKGLDILELSPYAIPCGEAANSCLTAFFEKTISNPTLQASYTDRNSLKPNSDRGYAAIGTSFAAPEVSGIAALTKQMFPWMTANNLRQTILTTATDIGEPGIDKVFGWGLANARKAVAGPAAFAFGDFLVNIERNRLPDASLNKNYYFTNNISGEGGLTYYNNTDRVLYLTGKNTYSGATKVLQGKLVLNNSLSKSNFEVSNGGYVLLDNSSALEGKVKNFGYFKVKHSSVRGDLINYGFTHWDSSRLHGSVVLANNAAIRASGNNELTGDIYLQPNSIFITDLSSRLVVKGKATLEGALGIEKVPFFVPRDGIIYKVIDALSFDNKNKRFTKSFVYNRANYFSLLNYDILYDDNKADVYILYQSKGGRISGIAPGSYNVAVGNAFSLGNSHINEVLTAANVNYKKHTSVTTNNSNVSPIDHDDSSAATDSSLIKDYFTSDKKPHGTNEVNPVSSGKDFAHTGSITSNYASARIKELEANHSNDRVSDNELDNNIDNNIDNKLNLVTIDDKGRENTTTIDASLAEKALINKELTSDPAILAAISMQERSDSAMAILAASASGSTFGDSLNSHRFALSANAQNFSNKVLEKSDEAFANKDFNKDSSWSFISNGNYFNQNWTHKNPDKLQLNAKVINSGLTIGGAYHNRDFSLALAYQRATTSWTEKGYADNKEQTYGEGQSTSHSFLFSANKEVAKDFRLQGNLGFSSDSATITRSVLEDNDLSSKVHGHTLKAGLTSKYRIFKLPYAQVDFLASLEVNNYHTNGFKEVTKEQASKAFALEVQASNNTNLLATLGTNVKVDLSQYHLYGKMTANLSWTQRLMGEKVNLADKDGRKLVSMYDSSYLGKVGLGYSINLLDNLELDLGGDLIFSELGSNQNFKTTLSFNF